MITNSKIYVEQGTPASPGIVFRGNPITGMSGAGGDFSLSIDNVEKLKLSNAGILSLPGYSGNNGKYLKMDASGVLSADTPAGGGATGSEVTYTGFAVKQDGTESATTSVFASKINKVVKLIFEEIKVNLSATTNTIKSRILPNNALWPDMAYNHMTSVFINNTQAYGRFVETQNNEYYFEFLTSPTLAWVAGTPITIQPFTITYISANNTALTGITWGTTYSDTVSPTITTFSSSGLVSAFGDIRYINIVFNEIVINFTISDLLAVGGSLSDFAGSGSSYSVTYTANTAGPYSIQISGVYTDVSGNTGPGQTLNLNSTVVFTTSGTWAVPVGVTTINVLVVAGGGGAGRVEFYGRSGAGGAGGLIYIPSWNCSGNASYSINIGNGGALFTNGGNTTIVGTTKTLTALGGGHGGDADNQLNATAGGSGGANFYFSPVSPGLPSTQPINTSDNVNIYNTTGYGWKGGDSGPNQPHGGGGGGAGGPGQNAPQAYSHLSTTDEKGNSLSGDFDNALGGPGKYYGDIFGTQYGENGWFASGGTANGYYRVQASTKAHLGGGGLGNNIPLTYQAYANGQPNTGGGAGSAGIGGSGIVIIKYQ